MACVSGFVHGTAVHMVEGQGWSLTCSRGCAGALARVALASGGMALASGGVPFLASQGLHRQRAGRAREQGPRTQDVLVGWRGPRSKPSPLLQCPPTSRACPWWPPTSCCTCWRPSPPPGSSSLPPRTTTWSSSSWRSSTTSSSTRLMVKHLAKPSGWGAGTRVGSGQGYLPV